ncbi:MAG: hypothetical protein JO257_09320, partial [Deltaproteobacteria bacterium]|nr:hypothetical protein [Deltaproteobacteria bacterium]
DGPASAWPDTLDGNRNRLLETYLAYLQSVPDTQMTNGLVGRNLHSVCDVWTALQPSARDVFLTLTHRLYGSRLAGGTDALSLVTRIYRIAPGTGATATSAGSCGGEGNRMIMSQDPRLHAAQLAASNRQGAAPYDLADITTFWRNSHDLGGPHAPFDLSDETNDGAPRGQTQYFKDPTSQVANTALGRPDIMNVVDPYALEMDQDYDCTHNSNPDCSYVFYGAACAPAANKLGTAIYSGNYGDFISSWQPAGCH